ncbi:hypothetical protein MMC34_007782 [Xylographa carneopallida]|nr:hypothetical protein [Xylographa carneopallida]
MGNVSSRPDDGSALHLKDQNRFSITSLTVTNSRRRIILNVAPNGYPASRIVAKRDIGDESPIEFIQDPEIYTAFNNPGFLLRLNNDDELHFNFTCVIRQTPSQAGPDGTHTNFAADTFINGLTFAFAASPKDLDVLVTREFHADPNLHKNSNVELVGSEYSTAGSPSIQLTWSWKWRPPKIAEDKGGGWRNTCTFVEYDQRAHRLNTLATFSFWVQNTPRTSLSPQLPFPQYELLVPPKLRVPSSQSVQSALSDSEGQSDTRELPSPEEVIDNSILISQASTKDFTIVDVACQRPGEDMSAVEDGPLFRATMKALEQKTGSMKTRMKKVLKKAEAAQAAQVECNESVAAFMDALREASASNANAVQPALEHYFEKIARQILSYEKQNTVNLQKLIIDPLSKLYNIDIKQAENKKKDFEDESKDYYAYVSRYLGQRQDSLKEKKRIDSDSKYQTKRRNFELKRFDYSSFMQDLHGGRKEQEVLSHLTKFADTQTKSYLFTAKKVEEMVPQLEALIHEVNEADKEFQFQRTEREEKRRILEKSTKQYIEPDAANANSNISAAPTSNGSYVSDSELSRADSNGRNSLHYNTSSASQHATVTSSSAPNTGLTPTSTSLRSISGSPITSPGQDRFKGIRDLEERHLVPSANSEKNAGLQRKEGLLWALSRPGSHVDPRGLNKQAWHKFWIVLDQGRLSEYSNWKERLDLHMEPIDLRLASVREARNAERRFCFEVITPNYKRVYQATSEEDMNNWISSINNALQSAVEGRSQPQPFAPTPGNEGSLRRDIGNVLTGKSPSYHGHQFHHSASNASANTGNNSIYRRTTVGARPNYTRTDSNSYGDNPMKLLQEIRDRDQGNLWCADCSSNVKTEWVSINLGIVLCIECSGIHRSLGTHVSKIRSLTLDTVSFTADIVEIIMQIGNRISNQIWEAKLEPSLKPQPYATRDQRLRFITEKYVERLYIEPLSVTLSHYPTADDMLVTSVKRNDIQQVLYAIALKANPNVTDRSRNTHVIFLALAAADPASPQGPGGASSAATSSSPRGVGLGTARKLPTFAIAEFLLQNGGEIPAELPAFPLSTAAQQYIEQRGAKAAGASAGGDTLTALPSIKSPTSPAEKERERLQKRTSAGARLVGRAIGA